MCTKESVIYHQMSNTNATILILMVSVLPAMDPVKTLLMYALMAQSLKNTYIYLSDVQ